MTAIVPCPDKFAEFICATRPGWEFTAVRGAITAAGRDIPEKRPIEDHWARIVRTFIQVVCDPDATPRDLLEAVRHPLNPPGQPPMNPDGRRVLVESTLATLAAASQQTTQEGI